MFSRKFICAGDKVCGYDNHVPAPLFRKKIKIEQKPESAMLTICGLGFYELYINGIKITKGELAPYINNPDDILYYDRYQIMPYLTIGDNVIGIMLGNGFFNAFGGHIWDFDKAPWRGPLRVAFSLELHQGNEICRIEADESVKVSESPVRFDELRIGVFYDARYEQKGWNTVEFDDSQWNNARYIASPKGIPKLCEVEPVVVYKELEPKSIQYFDDLYCVCESSVSYEKPIEKTRVKNAYVYDFGENNAGRCRLKIRGRRGQKVVLHFGEFLVDGMFSLRSTINMNSVEEIDLEYHQMDIYVLKGEEEEIFIPPFTYHGFRYVLAEGLTREQATEELLTYEVMSTDMKKRAAFECSCDVLNKLYDMACRSDRSNFVHIPTDCPHREKNGWTADVSLSAEHMLLTMSAEKGLSEWLYSVKAAQREDGALPGIVPTAGWGFKWGNGPGWDSVCVYLPYYCYKYTGDTKVILDNISMIFKYLRYIAGRRDERGLIKVGLEDWAQPKCVVEKTLAPVIFTDSAMIADVSQKASFLAKVVGEIELSKEAAVFANEMRSAIREHLIDFTTFTAYGCCQTSQVLAIEFGIFECDEIEDAFKRLLKIIHDDNEHMLCGVIGARFMFHVLARYGYADLAVKMITAPDYPSYANWVQRGDTTLSETFTTHDKGSRSNQDSRNHHFWGDISSFFIQWLAGLKINPFCRSVSEIEVSPSFVEALSFAMAEYSSVCGTIKISWKRAGDMINMSLEIPQGIEGDIILPAGYAFIDGEVQRKTECGIKEYGIHKL